MPDVEKEKIRLEALGVSIVEDGSNARGFAAIADPDGYHVQLLSQYEGEDDKLRAELAQLMSEPPPIINMVNGGHPGQLGTSPTYASFRSALKEQQERNRVSEALRIARGGSPVSPASPQ